jgi:hypothetical protein
MSARCPPVPVRALSTPLLTVMGGPLCSEAMAFRLQPLTSHFAGLFTLKGRSHRPERLNTWRLSKLAGPLSKLWSLGLVRACPVSFVAEASSMAFAH